MTDKSPNQPRTAATGRPAPGTSPGPSSDTGHQDEIEPVMVTLTFQTDRSEELLAVLAKYVVLSRMDSRSRNIDLVASMTKPGRLTIIEKWESSEAQQAHFDGAIMVEMAGACIGLLSAPPDIDLHEPVTMHDLS